MADEAASRALLLSSGTAEAVTVNQRALIDKILARYAAEFTVFRELIQNSDDAGAEACELRFYSQGHRQEDAAERFEGPPDLNSTLRSWLFRNNGKPFSNDDWNRLRRIAEGNPDPDRIGAFGVGFYSLFSISEEPIVSSGDQVMGFFWKGDSLFTRRASSASNEKTCSGQPWTTFHMPLREPAPFPDSFLDLSRFLATSLTFTGNVKKLSLYFDDHPLCRLQKTLEPSKALDMPSHLNTSSPRKMLRVTSLVTTAMKLEVEAMRLVLDLAEKQKKPAILNLASAFTKQGGSGGGLASMLQNAFGRSKKEEAAKIVPTIEHVPTNDNLFKAAKSLTTSAATVHVRIVTATANVSVDRVFEREIERSTKKAPPKVTRLQVVAQNREEAVASRSASVDGKGMLKDDMAEIFKGIMPSTDAQGHIFIGFRTSQTSSFAGHLAARFIPTVERESIDFIDRYCAQWNNELLAAAGYVTRAIYEAEMAQIGHDWTKEFGQSRPKEEDALRAKDLLERALHVMQYFTFRASTPSARIYNALESAFFACARQNTLTLASSRGVKHSALVRFPNATLADFVKDLAVIPPSHVEQASEFVAVIKSRGLIRDISMDDVFSELSGRALSVPEMTACLKWWISVASHPSYDASLLRQLLSNALVEDTGVSGKETCIQQLAAVKTHLNTHRLPTDVPLPGHCLIYPLSKSFSSTELYRTFNWLELSVPQWTQHIVVISRARDCPIETNIQLSALFAERVLGIVARSWGSLSAAQQEEVCSALKDCPCLPTKKGMVKPAEAYFANVSLFDDLPVVSFPSQNSIKGNLEKLLASLGVRKHVDLQMIFDRLVAAGDWDVVQLVTYLAANKDSLTILEKERLAKTAIFPKAGDAARAQSADGSKGKTARYRASQLYEPTESLKELNMPLIDWPGKVWRSNSEEAKFVFDLGLRRHPPLEELLRLASTANEEEGMRKKAFVYLLDKLPTIYKSVYSSKVAAEFAFVPCQDKDGKMVLVKPTDAFTNRESAILGFATVSTEISLLDVAKMGLRSNPTSAQIISKLINEPTRDIAKAKRIFEYLSGFPDFNHSDFKILSTAMFIPVARKAYGSTDVGGAISEAVVLARPTETFFTSTTANDDQVRKVLNDIFTFVDFGERASTFLRNCGVTNEPGIDEIARQLVRDPLRFFRIAGVEAYLGLLRQIATNWTKIPYGLRNEMKRSSFALASKRISVNAQKQAKDKSLLDDNEELDDDGDEQGVLVHDLKRADEIVIVDDATSHMLFASVIFATPHEDTIEAMLVELGARKLSTLVEERYVAAGQVQLETTRCQEVQAIVNERTPLFIFEKRQTAKSEIRHDADWLKNRLTVAQVDGRGLRLTRQLRFGSINVSDEQGCSAMAAIGNVGGKRDRLVLYIAANVETDWFEVAMALSKHLLSRQRLQEVLLFMTLLSTSLRNLKRRGFHVDKILSQRKADREAAERLLRDQRAKAELEAAQRPSESQIKQWTRDMLAVFPDAEPGYVERLLREAKGDHVVEATNAMLEQPYPKASSVQRNPLLETNVGGGGGDDAKAVAVAGKQDAVQQDGISRASSGGLFSNWRNRMRGNDDSSSAAAAGLPNLPGGWQPGQTKHQFPDALTAAIKASSAGQVADSIAGSVASGNTTSQATARNPNAGVTPSANIRRKVLSAIDASRGRAPSAFESSITSQGHQTKVKEAQSTYCDTTGVAMNLRLAGQIGSMNVYVSPELDPSQTLSNNGTQMSAFIEKIVKPIVSVFNIDVNSVNVFVDVSGPSIAFNRGGQLFLNFRYHLIWFDDEVRQGNLTNALISTYHSLAHELAHNLVAQHDSEHEFWFSSICEQFFVPFAALVSQSQSRT